jgi:hypothetical protein
MSQEWNEASRALASCRKCDLGFAVDNLFYFDGRLFWKQWKIKPDCDYMEFVGDVNESKLPSVTLAISCG